MVSGIIIRDAAEGDVRQISEIIVESWKTAYRGIIENAVLDAMCVDKQYEKEIKRYSNYVVAADGDTVLGYAWLDIPEDEAADCEIVALYARYACRKNGIGKLLLRYATDRFKDIGKKRMIIWCLKANTEAKKFYERTGGKEFRAGSHQWGGKEYDLISYLYDL